MASRVRRALASIGKALGLGAVFTCALAGGAVLHLNLPPARRSVERQLRSVLEGVFEGSVDAQGIEYLGLDGVRIDVVVVRDPSGIEVVRARGVRAEASVVSIVRNVLGDGDLEIHLPFARIEQADVRVEPNASGEISIAAAFQPRATGQQQAPGRPVRFALDRVEIGLGTVHGRPDGEHPIDADLRRVAGSVRVDPGLVAVDVLPTGLSERALLPGAIAGTAEYHLRVFGPKTPLDTSTPSGARQWATFAGRIGNVETTARALLDGDHVELTADCPHARPEHLKALIPSYPVNDTVAAHVDLKGDLPKLTFSADARTDKHGSVEAEGWINTAPPVRGEITFRTEALDPSVVQGSVPKILVTSRGSVRAELGPVVSVRIDTHTEPTSLEQTPIPAIDATAVYDGFVWSGSFKAHEPGAEVKATFATRKDGKVAFDATASAGALAKVPRLDGKLKGRATVTASGTADAHGLDAQVSGTVADLRAPGGVHIGRGAVRGSLRGPYDNLSIDANVTATDALLAGYAVQDATARIHGPLLKPRVSAQILDGNDTRIEAVATVDATAQSASNVSVRLLRDGAVVSGHVARIEPKGGGLRIEGIAMDGDRFGQLKGSLRVTNGELSGTLRGKDIDLATARGLLGLPMSIGGKADIDVALSPSKGGRKGDVRVSLRDGSYALVSGVNADLTASFDGDRVTTSGELSLVGASEKCGRTIAKVRLSNGDGRIRGKLLSLSTWRTMSGKVDVAAEDLDLACLAEMVPVGLPVSEIAGQVSAKFTVERQKADHLPSIRDLKARTYYLTVVGPEPADAGASPWASRDIDIDLGGDFDGESGETLVSLELHDHALLAGIDLAAHLRPRALLDEKTRAQALESTHVAGRISMPRRPLAQLDTLPTFVRDAIPKLPGEAAFDVFVNGSLSKPSVVARVFGWGVAAAPLKNGVRSPWAIPIDIDAATYYDGADAMLTAIVAHQKKQVLTADASLSAPIDKVRSGAPVATYLGGKAQVALSAAPIGDIPLFADRKIAGHIDGTITVADIGESPSLAVDLTSRDLQLGTKTVFTESSIKLGTDSAQGVSNIRTTADVHFSERAGGSLDASASLEIDWKDRIVPQLRADRPAGLSVTLRKFRLAASEPFIGGTIRDVSGEVDGGLQLGWGRIEDTSHGALDANLRISNASFYVPALGQGFHLTSPKSGPVRITSNKSGEVRVLPFVAESSTGRAQISANARFQGMVFQSAKATVSVPEKSALPVALEGIRFGTAWGDLEIAAKTSELNEPGERALSRAEPPKKMISVDLRSSSFHLKVPKAPSQDLQSLDPNPDIVISHTPVPVEEADIEDGTPLTVSLDLQNAIIEGPGIYLSLSSNPKSLPTFIIDREVRGRGEIRVNEGSAELLNRKFVLEDGIVELQKDATNPYLNVTAHWDPPDGSRIIVGFMGPLKPITREKLLLRSNPPRSRQNIMSMLLFGSESGGEITSGPPSDKTFGTTVGETAADLGGDLMAQQINALLSGIAPLKGLSTRLGVSEAGGIKGSLVYQLGDTVTALATYEGAAASGPGGANGGGTAQTAPTGSLTLDWRFYRNWLIRAKVGARDDETSQDRFTGTVEILWQYRY